MRILVIFTGGTIGSSVKGDWISPDGSTQSQLLFEYRQKTKKDEVVFSTLAPYNILSENLSAKQLNTLITCVTDEEQKEYDGIIVTHGTDTLQYSAAALDFTLQKRLPVVLVSADYPLDDERSNGLKNFAAAVRFLKEKPQAGVYVAYKNALEKEVNIHLATRLLAHAEGSADLYSLEAPYAMVDLALDKVICSRLPLSKGSGVGKIVLCEKPPILVVDSRPESSFGYHLEGIKAVLLSPYHSGTLNTASEDFIAFCGSCKQKGVPVFLINAPQGATYSSAKPFEELGIIPLPSTARIAAFVKCWIAISLKKEVKDFLLTPLSNEFI